LIQPSDDVFAERTEVLYNPDEIVKRVVEQCNITKYVMDACIDINGPSMMVIPNHPVTKAYLDMKTRGVKIRFISEITKDNLPYCKELMKFTELRHLDKVKGNFGIGDKKLYNGGATSTKSGPPPELVTSTVKSFVQQQQYFFDMLWNKAIPAEQRIRQIEDGIEPEVIETIRDPVEIQKIGNNLITSAIKEILIIFSTAKAFYRQSKAGTVDLLKQAAVQNPSIKIRILTPTNNLVKNQERREEEEYEVATTTAAAINKLLAKKVPHKQQEQQQSQFAAAGVDIRHIEPHMQTKVTVLIVDRKYSLIIELKDDSKDNSYEAIGLATYSNSKSTVLSYASIFESLWMQSELYQQLKEAHEQLKVHDKMQKEFINIAAHELRNPIQPILGLTDIVRRNETDLQQKEFLGIVARNARKLKQLTEDVLDVTRIESNTLQLNKEEFDLRDLVMHDIEEYKNQVAVQGNKIKLVYYEDGDDYYDHGNTQSGRDGQKVVVYADKYRLNQVITSLLSNSIKFTNDRGTISIKIKKVMAIIVLVIMIIQLQLASKILVQE
jgi:two-component system, OmpR family, sensor histidine kinase VicK